MNSKNIVILGAGISGRMAKLLLPEATVYEKQEKDTQIVNAANGPNYLKTPIKILNCSKIIIKSTIDGKTPTPSDIRRYKKKKGIDSDVSFDLSNELTYGDVKQFRSTQVEYKFTIPDVPASYNSCVMKIDLHNKLIHFKDREFIRYDILIATIPLITLMKLIGTIRSIFAQYVKLISSSIVQFTFFLKV